MFCGVFGMPFWSISWPKYLYRFLKESNLWELISYNMTTSNVVTYNSTQMYIRIKITKSYLSPSKCQKNVLWSAWSAILVHIMAKTPIQIFTGIKSVSTNQLQYDNLKCCDMQFNSNLHKNENHYMIFKTIKVPKKCFVEFLE